MKKIFIILSFFTISFSFISCDEEKNLGLQTLEDDTFVAPYVYFTLNGEVSLIHLDGNSTFNFDLNTLSTNNVVHTIYVQKGNDAVNKVELMTVTKFPSTITITGNIIASAFGDDYNDYAVSTNFKLSGSSIDDTGFELTSDNLHSYITGEAQNAYNFLNLNDIIIVE